MAELKCDMENGCKDDVAMIDDHGFVYCAKHGQVRKSSGRNCRKLRPHELNRLKRGEQVKSY